MPTAHRRASGIAGLLLALAASATALAAEDVPTVEVTGVVLDTDGQPAAVDSARVEEFETPDSEPVVTPLNVAADGTFTVQLREWGTPEAPARASFFVLGPRGEPVVINEEGCTETTTPFGTLEVEIPGQVPTETLEIVLDQGAEDGTCPPVTATPFPEAPAPAITLPPTDVRGEQSSTAVPAGALLLLGIAALGGAAGLLVTRPARVSPRSAASGRRRPPTSR